MWGLERERERERKRERERDRTERESKREGASERDRHRQTQRPRQRQKQRQRQRETETETERERKGARERHSGIDSGRNGERELSISRASPEVVPSRMSFVSIPVTNEFCVYTCFMKTHTKMYLHVFMDERQDVKVTRKVM